MAAMALSTCGENTSAAEDSPKSHAAMLLQASRLRKRLLLPPNLLLDESWPTRLVSNKLLIRVDDVASERQAKLFL